MCGAVNSRRSGVAAAKNPTHASVAVHKVVCVCVCSHLAHRQNLNNAAQRMNMRIVERRHVYNSR